tara:strand:+ start:22474 stop:22680 length:207 start_codon:yes stop_codon:yes gene_type:complete
MMLQLASQARDFLLYMSNSIRVNHVFLFGENFDLASNHTKQLIYLDAKLIKIGKSLALAEETIELYFK